MNNMLLEREDVIYDNTSLGIYLGKQREDLILWCMSNLMDVKNVTEIKNDRCFVETQGGESGIVNVDATKVRAIMFRQKCEKTGASTNETTVP